MPFQPDSLLHDRYRIITELGRGGMGAVYKGHDENLGVDVAIKENMFVSPESERQFKREANLLASLRHPNLPRVTDHFVISQQGQYLVMDFIPGEDAKTRLEANGGPLPEKDVVRWGREILDALNYLHTRPQPILHRDIKPGNIKITPDGRAVLVDFGLAKVHDSSQATTMGAKAFTPGFAPPEQYGLGRTDPRTDIYSLGATLYTLLTGQMPADSLERAMGQKQLTPIRDLNPSVSARTAEAIERALGVRPEERYLSAADFSAALPKTDDLTVTAQPDVTIKKEEPWPAPISEPEPAPPTPARSRTPMIVGGIVLLAIVGLGAGLWATGFFGGSAVSEATPTNAPATVVVIAATFTPEPPRATETPAPTDTAAPTEAPSPTVEPTIAPTLAPQATPRGGGFGQIAFVSERANNVPQVFVLDVTSPDTTQRQITDRQDGACQPAWSPDGTKILFISPCSGKEDQYPNATIYIINSDGSGSAEPLISRIGGVFDPDWSVTGIVFTALENRRAQIFLASPDAATVTRLSETVSGDSQPSWAPDGERLAFVNTSRSGRPTIYWMTKEGKFTGSNPDQITRNIDAASPAWSRNGQLVAFVSGQHIYVVGWDARGFDVIQLTSGVPNNNDPAWSPDSRWIAFQSWREGGNRDIWMMTANGGQPTRLTTDPAWDYQPAWRP
jgi:serine/threonine protein kinase/Tol biopolymer transport system component